MSSAPGAFVDRTGRRGRRVHCSLRSGNSSPETRETRETTLSFDSECGVSGSGAACADVHSEPFVIDGSEGSTDGPTAAYELPPATKGYVIATAWILTRSPRTYSIEHIMAYERSRHYILPYSDDFDIPRELPSRRADRLGIAGIGVAIVRKLSGKTRSDRTGTRSSLTMSDSIRPMSNRESRRDWRPLKKLPSIALSTGSDEKP